MQKLVMGGALVSACAAFAQFDESTLAFYGFSGMPDGAGATATSCLTNAVSTDYYGTGYEDEAGNITFDADSPGMYVFAGSARSGSTPIFTSPASIRLTSVSGTATYGGYMKFSGLQSALSQSASGTIEFFWKVPDDEPAPLGYKTAFGFDSCVKASGSDVRLGVSLPLAVSSGTFAYVSLNHTGINNWGNYATHPDAEPLSKWHHVALVFTNDGASCSFSIYSDYRYSATLSENLTMDRLESSMPLYVGRSFRNTNNSAGFHGKMSCLRVSSRALEVDEFLHVGDSPSPKVSFGDETLAFYSFSEAEGRDAASADKHVLLNDAKEGAFNGLAKKGSGGTISFSSDSPGAYVFTNLQNGADIVCRQPRSIQLDKSNIDFADIGTELSRHDESTLEFFWKIPTDTSLLAFNIKTSLNSGMTNSAGTACSFGLMFPMGAPGSTTDWTTYVRFSDAENLNLNSMQREYAASTADGKWHHVAVVYDHGTFRLYADYVKASSDVNGFWPCPLANSEPFKLGRDRYVGYISCLRVSSKALAPEQMLRVSSRTDCVPNEIFRHRFEGPVGASLSGVVSNEVATYGTLNPGVYSENDVSCRIVKADGDAAPQLSGSHWKNLLKAQENAESVLNNGSALCRVTAAPLQSDTFSSGPGFQFEQDMGQTSTLEFFARLDYDGYASSTAAETAADRMALVSCVNSDGKALWSLVASRIKQDDTRLSLYTYTYDGNDVLTINQQAYTVDPNDFRRKWHRYAVTNDPAEGEISVWYDGDCVMTCTAAGMKVKSPNACTIGTANSFNAFCGWFDEFRYSRAILSGSQMQRPWRMPGSMFMIR